MLRQPTDAELVVALRVILSALHVPSAAAAAAKTAPASMAAVRAPSLTMTTAQVSERYGIATGTLRQWRRRGMRPHAFRIHGVVLYETAEVEAFMAECRDGER